jgi:hypothetical protein
MPAFNPDAKKPFGAVTPPFIFVIAIFVSFL